jgi:hypothetical protein
LPTLGAQTRCFAFIKAHLCRRRLLSGSISVFSWVSVLPATPSRLTSFAMTVLPFLSYDRPSSSLASPHNNTLNTLGISLDRKMDSLLVTLAALPAAVADRRAIATPAPAEKFTDVVSRS